MSVSWDELLFSDSGALSCWRIVRLGELHIRRRLDEALNVDVALLVDAPHLKCPRGGTRPSFVGDAESRAY